MLADGSQTENDFIFHINSTVICSKQKGNKNKKPLVIIVRYALCSRRYQILNRLSERQRKIVWFSDTVLNPYSSPIINSR